MVLALTSLSIISLLFLSQTIQAASSQKLAFVFEIVRHGARTGLMQVDNSWFPVPMGMLTPQGMRQRYILGNLNR